MKVRAFLHELVEIIAVGLLMHETLDIGVYEYWILMEGKFGFEVVKKMGYFLFLECDSDRLDERFIEKMDYFFVFLFSGQAN